MTAEQFAYWMQGFAELNEGPPTAEQWQSIRDHLALVFTKLTPPVQAPAIMPHMLLTDPPQPAVVWSPDSAASIQMPNARGVC